MKINAEGMLRGTINFNDFGMIDRYLCADRHDQIQMSLLTRK